MTKWITGVLVAAAALAAPLSAQATQDGLELGLKLKAGATAGALKEDLRANKMVGAGIFASYHMGGGALIGEVSYQYFSAVDYWAPLPAGSTTANSVDRRRNNLSGWNVRAGYRAPLFAGWHWQAGGGLDILKSRQEVSGQITSGTNVEGLSVTPETTKMSPSVFGGIYTKVGDSFTFEANVVSVGYSRVNWITATSGAGTPRAETTARRGLVLEACFGFRF